MIATETTPGHGPFSMLANLKNRQRLLLGVISDTHGHLPPPVITAFHRVDVILHAGDIDTPAVFDALQRLAPVVAVRGNMDRGRWAADLPPAEIVMLGGLQVYMLHDLSSLDLDPAAADIRLVVSGHTHRPAAEIQNGVLLLNPGSAVLPRGAQAATVALVTLDTQRITHRWVALA
jgi:putative phosphoesterase